MNTEEKIPQGVINPFSETFADTWKLWKDYRWEAHKFKYKGNISEQMKLKSLVDLSGGDEQKAVEIVQQSIGNMWMDFYKLKVSKAKDGKSTKKQPVSNEDTRQSLNDLYNQRFGTVG